MESQLTFLKSISNIKPTHIKKESNPKKQSTIPDLSWKMFIDGASRGNPGPSGAGIFIEDKRQKTILSKSFFLKKKTNNQAEYLALALGIFFLKKELNKLKGKQPSTTIISDSQLLIRQMIGFYKIKDPTLQSIKAVISSLLEEVPYEFKHVTRSHNKKADLLANKAIDDKRDSIPKELMSLLKQDNVNI